MCFTFKKNNKQTKKPVYCFLRDDASAGIQSLQTSIEIKLCQNPWNGLQLKIFNQAASARPTGDNKENLSMSIRSEYARGFCRVTSSKHIFRAFRVVITSTVIMLTLFPTVF